jgi:hypothetical protein
VPDAIHSTKSGLVKPQIVAPEVKAVAYTDQSALGADATFKGRIQVAVVKAAVAVQAEDPAGLALPAGYTLGKDALHAARSRLATRILADPTGYATLFAVAVAADPNTAGITGASSDSDLLFTVNALFTAFALGS